MRSQGRNYLVTKSSFAGGGSLKIVAQELGGNDYISGNVYYLNDGARLFPCEMSRDKVTEFLRDLEALD